jgi:hypothetical protein
MIANSCFILDEEPEEEDIFLHEEEKRPTGQVIGIIKRNWKPYPIFFLLIASCFL